MLDFAEVLDMPLIFLTLCRQSSRSKVIGRGGGSLRLFALSNFNFQIRCEFEAWPADNLLKDDTLYETISFPAGKQDPEDIPLWSYFGQDIPDHNRTKIKGIRLFNLFWLFNA